ncbi:MAG: hypothetical protein CO098_19950, partial [Bacteroidetes bacterium CG_4_9_14_3_um_filter_41_19]
KTKNLFPRLYVMNNLSGARILRVLYFAVVLVITSLVRINYLVQFLKVPGMNSGVTRSVVPPALGKI